MIFLRHGETNLNGPPGSSQERLRGWLPADLTPKGHKQAQAAAENLKGIPIASFHSSDLPRAAETASHVTNAIGMPATHTFNLRDWNTGDLAGQKFPDVKDHLFHLIDNPDTPAPNGESLNTYIQRFVPFVKSLVESPDTHLVVGHARGTQVLRALADNNGEWITPKPLKDKPVTDPGQSLIISPDWSTIPSK